MGTPSPLCTLRCVGRQPLVSYSVPGCKFISNIFLLLLLFLHCVYCSWPTTDFWLTLGIFFLYTGSYLPVKDFLSVPRGERTWTAWLEKINCSGLFPAVPNPIQKHKWEQIVQPNLPSTVLHRMSLDRSRRRLDNPGIHKGQGHPILSSVVADLRCAAAMLFGLHFRSKQHMMNL